MVGVGGVIRDSCGTHTLSFSSPVGSCSVNKAEMFAFKSGLWKVLCASFMDHGSWFKGILIVPFNGHRVFQWPLGCLRMSRRKWQVLEKPRCFSQMSSIVRILWQIV